MMDKLPPEALLRRLDLAIRRRMDGRASGEHRAFGAQGGMELDRIRPWAPGDDWRHLDAAATARTGVPHIRVPVAERRLTLWLGIDTSSSMAFGTDRYEKCDIATWVAGVLGLVALRQASRVGVLPLVDGSDTPLPPRTGRPALLQMLEALQSPREDARSNLSAALNQFDTTIRERSTVVVVSDFRDSDVETWRSPLAKIGLRHELICIEIRDQREVELPDVGIATFRDPETGRIFTIDTSSRGFRERFRTRARAHANAVERAILSAGADHMVVATGPDWLERLMAQIHARRRRRWVSATPQCC